MSVRCCLSVLYAFSSQMSERWSLTIVMANWPEFLLWVIFCVYLLLYAALRLLHLTAQILYTMHVLFHIYTGSQIFANMFSTQRLAAVATSISPAIVRSKRQLILKHARVYLYPSSWAHSLVHARLWEY